MPTWKATARWTPTTTGLRCLEDPIEEGFEELDWFCDLPFIHTRSKKPPEDWPGMVVDYMRPAVLVSTPSRAATCWTTRPGRLASAGVLPFMSTYRCTRQDRGASLGKITTDKEIHDERD